MKRIFAWTLMVLMATGCAGQGLEQAPRSKGMGGKADSSFDAVFVDFNFSASIISSTTSTYWLGSRIENQLMYSVGLLNADRSVARMDKLNFTVTGTEALPEGGYRVSYDASLVVAWGKTNSVPETYTFSVPAYGNGSGIDAFVEKYKTKCVDWGAHDVSSSNMWYYYRPERYGCNLDPADVVEITATVTPSEIQTNGKYPEYHKVWEDDALKVVAVFGKYEDGATSNGDAGIAAYNRFLKKARSLLNPHQLVTVPESVPNNPGVDLDDVTFSGTLSDGKKVQIVALLVNNVRTAPYSFTKRYEVLSRDADLITYNGHAGYGANIRSLAQKGDWQTGQYAMVFMNGCDTYAYVDSALADAHAAVNADDQVGTRYVDIVMNALPSYFSDMDSASMSLIRALMNPEQPKTYEQIFQDVSRRQVILVSGEGDNVYYPGYDPDGGDPDPETWEGLDESGNVTADQEHRFETPVLEAGRYSFVLSGDGDADLYVRIGDEPTTGLYDCRPYLWGSAEKCEITLDSAAALHVMVRGWDPSSNYRIVGSPVE